MDRIIEPLQERILEMTMNQRLTSMLLFLMMTTLVSANDITPQELSARDQIRVAVQEICPISGQKLGGHGVPVKVKVGELEVFICCKPCLEKKINSKYWSAMHQNIAAAQEICLPPDCWLWGGAPALPPLGTLPPPRRWRSAILVT